MAHNPTSMVALIVKLSPEHLRSTGETLTGLADQIEDSLREPSLMNLAEMEEFVSSVLSVYPNVNNIGESMRERNRNPHGEFIPRRARRGRDHDDDSDGTSIDSGSEQLNDAVPVADNSIRTQLAALSETVDNLNRMIPAYIENATKELIAEFHKAQNQIPLQLNLPSQQASTSTTGASEADTGPSISKKRRLLSGNDENGNKKKK